MAAIDGTTAKRSPGRQRCIPDNRPPLSLPYFHRTRPVMRSRSQFDVLGRSESLNNARPPVAHHTTRQPNRPVNHTMRDEMNGQHHETHFAI